MNKDGKKYSVTGIDDNAFSGCSGLTSISYYQCDKYRRQCLLRLLWSYFDRDS